MTAKSKILKFSCIPIKQGTTTLYALAIPAKTLWNIVQINTREPNKDVGYQRVLSTSRVRAIAKYIAAKNPIPTSILVSFGTSASIDSMGTEISITAKPDAGWVIDGQHRLAGAHMSSKEIELPVIAFIGLDIEEQIQQFITINKEAKGVPTSLYYDLLPHLSIKSASDRAKERAADIASELRKDEESPFAGRIVITTTPKKGELSLNNFVRKIYPLLLDGKALSPYSVNEQKLIIANYYRGLQIAFPTFFTKHSSLFFQTIGFGGLINVLPTFLNLCIKTHKAFKVEDVAKVFGEIKHFDFSAWERLGTGTAAETQAGEDLKAELLSAFENAEGDTPILDLG